MLDVKPDSDDDTFVDVWFDSGKDTADGATSANLKERPEFYDLWIEKGRSPIVFQVFA